MSYKRDNIKEPIQIKKILLVTLLQEGYVNYRFREQVTQKGIVFNYKIYKVARGISDEKSIVEKANRLVSLI